MNGVRFQTEYDRSFEYRGGYRTREPIEDQDFAGKESTKMYATIEPPLQRKKRITGPYAEDHVQLDNYGGRQEDEFMLIGQQDKMYAPCLAYKNSAQKRHPPRPSTAPPGGRNRHGRTGKEMGTIAAYPDQGVYDDIEVPTPDTPRVEKRAVSAAAYPQQPPRRQTRSPVRGGRGKPTYFKSAGKQGGNRTMMVDTRTQTKENNLENALRLAAHVKPDDEYQQYRDHDKRPATRGGRERSPVRERPLWRYGYKSKSQSPPKIRGYDEIGEDYDYTRVRNRNRENYETGEPTRYEETRVKKYYKDDRAKYEDGGKDYYTNADRARYIDARKENYMNGGHTRYENTKKDRYQNRYQYDDRPMHDDKAYREEYPHRGNYNIYDTRVNNKPLIKSSDADLDREIMKLKDRNEKLRRSNAEEDFEPREEPNANYARKHKLGLAAANRPIPLQHSSEYRRQFDWKRGLHDSPLINAQDLVYRSHLDAPRSLKAQSKTEYRRQFAPMPEPRRRHRSLSPEPRRGGTSAALIRSRSSVPLRARSPPPRVIVEGKEYVPSQTLNPQRMSFPLGPHRRVLSEYSDNFRSLQPDTPTWYQQILDLRNKVHEYRQRGRGTHFSREHLVQLMSKSNDHWDPPSSSQRYQNVDRPPAGIKTFQQAGRPHSPDCYNGDEEDEGRIATPRIETGTRNHLDKTTPAVGGTLLTTPQTQFPPSAASSGDSSGGTPTPRRLRLDLAAAGKPSLNTHEILNEEASYDTPIRKPEEPVRSRRQSRTSYKPSQKKPIAAQVVRNPPRLNGAPRDWAPTDLADDGQRPLYSATNGYQASSSSKEGSVLRTPLGHKRQAVQVDNLSTRSLISSGSLASETLERARARRDEFWRDG